MAYSDEVIVTGASGFVGGFVCDTLQQSGARVRRFSRSVRASAEGAHWSAFDPHAVRNPSVFEGAKIVIHLAGRAHVLHDRSSDPRLEYFKDNVEASIRIARLASDAGVKRLVFASSVGVNGNASGVAAFDENSVPAPIDLYAVSKYEAERALSELCDKSGMELVVIRAPLVYGPGNPGNFLRLLKLVRSGLPLPLGCFSNLKSLVFVENLASAFLECARHPAAAGQTYLVSDGYDVSTAELITLISVMMRRRPRITRLSTAVVERLSRMVGKAAALEKLTSTLLIDSSKIRRELNWQPPVLFHEGLSKTVDWFMAERLS